MSYGGHGSESGNRYTPPLNELAEIRSWVGPSAAAEDLGKMLGMVVPVCDLLLERPVPDGESEEGHEAAAVKALSLLNRIRVCLEALIEPAVDTRFSFAQVVYLASVTAREKFDNDLSEGYIDRFDHDELAQDLTEAASNICSAYDLVTFGQSLSAQNSDYLVPGEHKARPGFEEPPN